MSLITQWYHVATSHGQKDFLAEKASSVSASEEEVGKPAPHPRLPPRRELRFSVKIL